MVGESAIRDIGEIGSKVIRSSHVTKAVTMSLQVIHSFHVVNDGPWQADSVNVHIEWPYQVIIWLQLYLSFGSKTNNNNCKILKVSVSESESDL